MTFGDQQRSIDPRGVGLEVDVDTTVGAGRERAVSDLDAWEVVKSPFERIVSGDDVPLRVSWDHDKVVATLVEWEAQQVSGYSAGDVTFAGGPSSLCGRHRDDGRRGRRPRPARSRARLGTRTRRTADQAASRW